MDNTMNYTYQRLSQADIPLFKQLLKVFGEAFDEVETYQGAVPNDEYLSSLLGKKDFIALAARDGDGTVVGGLTAYVLQKFERDRREIYIYDLAVAESHRRKGIATTLINQLKQIAKEEGAYVIFVQADEGDEAAIALYKSLGAQESVYQFDIPVDHS